MLKLHSKVQINTIKKQVGGSWHIQEKVPAIYDSIISLEIERNHDNMTSTCKLVMPRRVLTSFGRYNLLSKNTSVVSNDKDLLGRGRNVSIRIGYDGTENLVFSGWVVKKTVGEVVTLYIEDDSFMFKDITVKDIPGFIPYTKATTMELKDYLFSYLKIDKLESKWLNYTTNNSIEINGWCSPTILDGLSLKVKVKKFKPWTTLYEILYDLKKDYGLYIFVYMTPERGKPNELRFALTDFNGNGSKKVIITDQDDNKIEKSIYDPKLTTNYPKKIHYLDYIDNITDDSKLYMKDTSTFNYRIKVTGIRDDSKKRDTIYVGPQDGDEREFYYPSWGLVVGKNEPTDKQLSLLYDYANVKKLDLETAGFDGSVTIFGLNWIEPGDIIYIDNTRFKKDYEYRNGYYLVGHIVTKFGLNGFRHELFIKYQMFLDDVKFSYTNPENIPKMK